MFGTEGGVRKSIKNPVKTLTKDITGLGIGYSIHYHLSGQPDEANFTFAMKQPHSLHLFCFFS